MLRYRGRTDLTASEAHDLFQDALERELVRALDPHLAHDSPIVDKVRHNKVMAGLYRWAQLPVDELQRRQTDTSFTFSGGNPELAPKESPFPRLYAQACELRDDVEQECPSALERVDVPRNPETIAQALLHRLRGRAAAHDRAQLAEHPRIRSCEDVIDALLDEALVNAIRDGVPAAVQHDPATTAFNHRIYLEEDTRRFADVIDEVCGAIQSTKDWNADLRQRQRIMKAFAWVTGNKRLCDYRPSDIANFKTALVRLPTTFRWKKHWDRPFEAVIGEFPAKPPENRRDDRTINRDLSTMARVSSQLALTSWMPASGSSALVMNFAPHARAFSGYSNA